jgi:hypothetical protein
MAARLKSMAQRIDLGRSPNLDATVAIEPDALHLVRLGAFPNQRSNSFCSFHRE